MTNCGSRFNLLSAAHERQLQAGDRNCFIGAAVALGIGLALTGGLIWNTDQIGADPHAFPVGGRSLLLLPHSP